MKNFLTVDLEDWFQSSLELFCDIEDYYFKIQPTNRVVINTEKLLKIFDEYNVKATFFVLGTVAETFPALIKEIQKQGHEIATHGYGHKLVYKQTQEEFKKDLKKSIDIIENITKEKVVGYRAPYFSITDKSLWAIEIIKELGFVYDASIFPLKRKLYGTNKQINIQGFGEFPTSKISFCGVEFPFAGGGYLRLYPYWLTKWAMNKLNSQGKPAMVYIHPYEIDSEDTQDYKLSKNLKTKIILLKQNLFRQKTEYKLNCLLRDFSFVTIKESLK